ncbi:conserved Plasmodium protein, unknown function [Plasmodium vinckei brucechwatti]|uniref:Heptatricopeptide repeat-containing protein HPR1 n=1 Tax=Plasmodium vinckei brucechwatti TaxID=119398 RepID=A0A6V7RX01_PLAVN|nr:conserved Plasmodium protein, unknown function [Plasmodium vinckei brucechwatti]
MCGMLFRRGKAKKIYPQNIGRWIYAPFVTCTTNDNIILKRNYEEIKNLKAQELRKLSENCCIKKISDVIIWSEICRNAIKKSDEFKHFDALLLLSCFDKMNLLDKSLYTHFSDIFIKHINNFEPRHLILLINLYCKVNIFPRILFIEVFHAIIRYSPKLYPSEYVDIFECFAKYEIANKDLISTLCKSIIKNINLFGYTDLCSIVGSLRSLKINDDVFFYCIDEKQLKELKMSTCQELFDYINKIKLLKYSWELYEKDLIKEFLNRINDFKNGNDVNQLHDPFICLNYLISKNIISNNFLLTLSMWCANQVYQYPSRSAKRPLSYQLIKLYQIMKEHNVENYDFIEKAIHKFVISRGGLATNREKITKPVSYQKGRKYIFTPDPLNADSEDTNKYIDSSNETENNLNENEQLAYSNMYQGNDKDFDSIEADSYNENANEHIKYNSNILTQKQRLINLSLEKKTENKKETYSNSRHCNFKLRQRPKRIKNQPISDQK